MFDLENVRDGWEPAATGVVIADLYRDGKPMTFLTVDC